MALTVDVYKGTKKKTGIKYGSSAYIDALEDGFKLTSTSKKAAEAQDLYTGTSVKYVTAGGGSSSSSSSSGSSSSSSTPAPSTNVEKSVSIGGKKLDLIDGVWYEQGTGKEAGSVLQLSDLQKLTAAFGGDVFSTSSNTPTPEEKETATPAPTETPTETTPVEEEEETTTKDWDDSDFKNSSEYKALSDEDQQAVLAVFGAIAGNDATQAQRLTEAFKAAGKINDPYFAQQLRLATDAIERGYVSIDKEAEFAEQQLVTRLADFKEDFENKKEFLTLEQSTALRGIERNYTQELDTLQQNLSATGFGSSSRRAKKEGFLNEATGDLRESTNRSFAYQQEQGELALGRSQRDTAKEVARLKEITKEGKLSFLRDAEAEVGSKGLPDLGVGAPSELGGIQGSLAEEKLQNTINSASSFVF